MRFTYCSVVYIWSLRATRVDTLEPETDLSNNPNGAHAEETDFKRLLFFQM